MTSKQPKEKTREKNVDAGYRCPYGFAIARSRCRGSGDDGRENGIAQDGEGQDDGDA
jgi:hypothetical protein